LNDNFIRISEDLLGYGVQPFEGPLDLLLYLIKQDEIDIYDIPVAKITANYLAYLETMKELDLEIAGEFILTASMLIRIKSQMLIPRGDGEDVEVDDPRSELVAALLEYKKFKEAADDLKGREADWTKRYGRGDQPEIIEPEVNYVLRKVDVTALMISFAEVLKRAPIDADHQVGTEEVHIEDRIRHIANLLSANSGGIEFTSLFEDDPRRLVMVVTFVALLELTRMQQIKIKQAKNFGKIWIYPDNLQLDEAIKLYAESI